MKIFPYSVLLYIGLSFNCLHPQAQTNSANTPPQIRGEKQLLITTCRFEPGTLKYEALTAAHAKGLAVHDKYGILIKNYRFKEEKGLVFCPGSAYRAGSIGKVSPSPFPSQRNQLYYTNRNSFRLPILKNKAGGR